MTLTTVTLNSSSGATHTCRNRPGCFKSRKASLNQTWAEINRILPYTELLIKIFAQLLEVWDVNLGLWRWMKAVK